MHAPDANATAPSRSGHASLCETLGAAGDNTLSERKNIRPSGSTRRGTTMVASGCRSATARHFADATRRNRDIGVCNETPFCARGCKDPAIVGATVSFVLAIDDQRRAGIACDPDGTIGRCIVDHNDFVYFALERFKTTGNHFIALACNNYADNIRVRRGHRSIRHGGGSARGESAVAAQSVCEHYSIKLVRPTDLSMKWHAIPTVIKL